MSKSPTQNRIEFSPSDVSLVTSGFVWCLSWADSGFACITCQTNPLGCEPNVPPWCVLLRVTHTHRTGAARTSCDPVGRSAQRNRWAGNPDYTGKLLYPCSRSFHRPPDRSRSSPERHSGRLGKEQGERVNSCVSTSTTFYQPIRFQDSIRGKHMIYEWMYKTYNMHKKNTGYCIFCWVAFTLVLGNN